MPDDYEENNGTPSSSHAGALPMALDPNTLFALRKGGFILYGTARLASGAVIVSDNRIRSGSKAMLTYDVAARTLHSSGTLSGACTNGQLAIASTSGSDTSDVAFVIIL